MNTLISVLLTVMAFAVPATGRTQAINVFEAAREGNISAIKACDDANCDVNSRNEDGYTPFILAAYHGHNAALAELLKLGADPCAVDGKGNNAFMGVAFKGYVKTAEWLLDNTQCDVNHQNLAGQTALMMVSLFGREAVIQLMLEHGAKKDLADRQGNTADKLAQAQGLSKVVEMVKFHIQ